MKRRAYAALAGLAILGLGVIWFANRSGEGTEPVAGRDAVKPPMQEASDKPAKLPRPSADADKELAAQRVPTDMSLDVFPRTSYTRRPSPAGPAAGAPTGGAFVHVPSDGKRLELAPNQLGEFPVVDTRLRDTVGVRVEVGAVKPGTPVRVVLLDGGTFPSAEGVSQVLKSTDWGGVSFEFLTSGNIGSHRVLVQAAGQPSRILDFNAVDPSDS